jgi:hypothetical protein
MSVPYIVVEPIIPLQFLFDLTAQLGYNIKAQAFSKGD